MCSARWRESRLWHKDSPLYAMEEPDDIDLFIRANISEVLLKESPVDAGDDKDKGTE